MNGNLDLENNSVKKADILRMNSLKEKCATAAYAEILEAYQRICQRLGVGEEDGDVEIIINNFNVIMECLCRKMYDYGCFLTAVY